MRNLFLFIMTFIMLSCTMNSKEIWIYSDDGTWSQGIVALEQFFNHNGIAHRRIYASDLNNKINYSEAEAICFPGGFAFNYKVALTSKTINAIRDYVAKGGNYLGICAGAFFASTNVVWEGKNYSYELGLFEGNAIGSIYSIAKWDNYAITNISINKRNPILKIQNNKFSTLYYGGPFFTSNKTKFDTVATYDVEDNLPAIINFNYEQGRVLLIGPHLEIEENSDRDSTAFSQELIDKESDWELLSDVVNWLIRKESFIENQIADSKLKQFQLFPNPVQEFININLSDIMNTSGFCCEEIKILNTFGECVLKFELKINDSNYLNRIDVSHLPNGLYFVRIGNYFKSVIVLR